MQNVPGIQDLRVGSTLFSDFFCEVRESENEKIDKAQFLKNGSSGREDPKMAQQWGFGGFDKNFIHCYVFFSFCTWI